MNNPGFKNCIDELDIMEKYGLRQKHTTEKPSLDGHSTMIKNETSGVEPFALDKIEMIDIEHLKRKQKYFEKEYVSCIITPGGENNDFQILSKMRSNETS
jgi:hypothetical protein